MFSVDKNNGWIIINIILIYDHDLIKLYNLIKKIKYFAYSNIV